MNITSVSDLVPGTLFMCYESSTVVAEIMMIISCTVTLPTASFTVFRTMINSGRTSIDGFTLIDIDFISSWDAVLIPQC